MKLREKATKNLTGGGIQDQFDVGATGEKHDNAIAKLQEELKKRDQTIVNMKKVAEKNKTSKEQVIAEKDKMAQDMRKLNDTIQRLTQDKMKLDGTNTK